MPANLLATLSINTVQIGQDQITVSGRSTLPAGTCIYTQLSAEDEALGWWPADSCDELSGGAWQIDVSFGIQGRPDRLDQGAQYTLQAWAEGEPRLEARPFIIELDDPNFMPPIDELPTPGADQPPRLPTPVVDGEAPPASGTLRVTSVQVSRDQVVIGGRSTYPGEICLHTRLVADDELLVVVARR